MVWVVFMGNWESKREVKVVVISGGLRDIILALE